jgi:hypothetical protein
VLVRERGEATDILLAHLEALLGQLPQGGIHVDRVPEHDDVHGTLPVTQTSMARVSTTPRLPSALEQSPTFFVGFAPGRALYLYPVALLAAIFRASSRSASRDALRGSLEGTGYRGRASRRPKEL